MLQFCRRVPKQYTKRKHFILEMLQAAQCSNTSPGLLDTYSLKSELVPVDLGGDVINELLFREMSSEKGEGEEGMT